MEKLNQEIGQALYTLRHSSDNRSKERQWIVENLGDKQLEKEVNSLSVVALHALSNLISSDLTGIELAAKLHVTRGGITRAMQNLVKFDMVSTASDENDSRKLYYHLTEKGQKVAHFHDELHKIMDARFDQVFAKYDEQQKQIILDFLTDFNKAKTEFE